MKSHVSQQSPFEAVPDVDLLSSPGFGPSSERSRHGGRVGVAVPPEVRPMRRAVVTGVAGFIGSHLAEALLGAGWCVTGIDHSAPGCGSAALPVRLWRGRRPGQGV